MEIWTSRCLELRVLMAWNLEVILVFTLTAVEISFSDGGNSSPPTARIWPLWALSVLNWELCVCEVITPAQIEMKPNSAQSDQRTREYVILEFESRHLENFAHRTKSVSIIHSSNEHRQNQAPSASNSLITSISRPNLWSVFCISKTEMKTFS